jgi:hypothetical protein
MLPGGDRARDMYYHLPIAAGSTLAKIGCQWMNIPPQGENLEILQENPILKKK